MTRLRRLGALLAIAGLAVSGAAHPAGARPSAVGAAGIGDAYFPSYGNGGYRVHHYDISVRFDPATERLSGKTIVIARAHQRLSRFDLDLVLDASAVSVNGQRARFRQTPHELIVTPRTTLSKGQRMRVAVSYAGHPGRIKVDGVRPWVTTPSGAVAIGQPEIAAWWFPSNDHPADKATFAMHLGVPRGKQAISNGRPVSHRTQGGWTTWNWRSPEQMTTYLAFAAFGSYDLERGRTSSGRPYLYALDRGLADRTYTRARRSLHATGEVTDFLARTWGAYPFKWIGGVVPQGRFGYALENQTRPVYAPGFFSFGANKNVVVHEMAHQWFGNAVALKRWRHIWLSEGFATYSEWLWDGQRGVETPDHHFHRIYDNLGAGSPFWKLTIGNPGANKLFNSAVYDRGAMTLHALRLRVGDTDFFTIGRRWVHDNADGLGTTREFRALAERVSGLKLGALFTKWLFTPRKPTGS